MIYQPLESQGVYRLPIYMCTAYLYDINSYNSSALLEKNYADLTIINDKLKGYYKVLATSDYLEIKNTGGSASIVRLIVLGA